MMHSCVTTPAQRQQIVQRIVPQLFGSGHASAINVMDMQILSGAAVLTGEVVTLQGVLPVAAKTVIVFSFADIFIPLGIFGKRLANLLNAAFLQADKAVLLRPGAVDEIGTTLNALERGTNRHSAFLFPQFTQMQHILFLPIRWSATVAALLRRASGLVEHFADEALALLKAVASLPVSSQRTRLASLQVGRCLGHLRPAIRAIENAVSPRFHNLNTTLPVL
jgi:hypothetical protein